MIKKKLSEYCTITCDPGWFKSLAINTGYIGGPTTTGCLIPAADVEMRDKLSAAKDKVIEAAEVIHKGWHKFDDCFGGPYGECDGIGELLDALHVLDALEAVQDGN